MAITKRVQQELVEAAPTAAASLGAAARPNASAPRPHRRRSECSAKSEPLKLTKAQREAAAARSKGKAWTAEEHQRFLEALERFPAGPWKAIANYVGTKNSRQTMTHAQKCREKHDRKTRMLRHKAAATKKAKRVATRRQPSRRRATKTATTSRRIQEHQRMEEDYSDVATDRGEEIEIHEELECDKEDSTDDVVLDETTFFSGCDDALAASAAGSPPLMSLLSSLPDHLLFNSDDLWQSQSLAEVALGAAASQVHDDEHDATDLEDLQDFAVGLSQECW